MGCFYWLMNKETGLAYSKVEGKWIQGEAMELPPETDAKTLPSKPLPRGQTKINGDGLS